MSRRFQFSLKVVLIAMTAFAIWLGVLAHRAHNQRDAVAKIEALGGIVYYDSQDVSRRRTAQPVGAPKFDRSRRPTTSPLRKALGDDFFHEVVVVDFSEAKVSNQQIMEVHAALPYVAIGSPKAPGYHNLLPDRTFHYDATSLAMMLAGIAFTVWLVGQVIIRKWD